MSKAWVTVKYLRDVMVCELARDQNDQLAIPPDAVFKCVGHIDQLTEERPNIRRPGVSFKEVVWFWTLNNGKSGRTKTKTEALAAMLAYLGIEQADPGETIPDLLTGL